MQGTQSSAKDLIHHWESFGNVEAMPFTHPRKQACSPASSQILCSPATLISKKKSPMRQSFLNFVYVFKKPSKYTASKESRSPASITTSATPPPTPPAKDPWYFTSNLTNDIASPQQSYTTAPEDNAILYFDQRSTPSVWRAVQFEVTEHRSLNLLWSDGPGGRIISLSGCSDVQSVTTEEINDLCPPPDMKCFMVLCAGQIQETFAAPSTFHRAKCVSDIWEAVLTQPEAALLVDPSKDSFSEHSVSRPPSLHLPPRPLPRSPSSASIPKSPIVSSPAADLMVTEQVANLNVDSTASNPTSSTVDLLPSTATSLTKVPSNTSAESNLEYNIVASTIPDVPSESSPVEDPAPCNLSLPNHQDIGQLDVKMDRLSENLAFLPSQILETSLSPGFEHIGRNLQALDTKTEASQAALESIQAKIANLEDQLKASSSPESNTSNEKLDQVASSMDEVRNAIPSLLQGMDTLQTQIGKINVQPSPLPDHTLANLPPPPTENASAEQNEILALLKSDSEARDIQTQQQATSVRYLNELNQWLETFVSHGTSQIQEINTQLHQLRAEGQAIAPLLTDIQHTLAETRKSLDNNNSIQDSLESLRAFLENASSTALTTEAVTVVLERHKEEQDARLRSFTAELSSEIRGERLRFVEAMKEATSINVDAHVQQLKQELTREILMMIAQASHLYKEKQATRMCKEKQAAEGLMAFYTRQAHTQAVRSSAHLSQQPSEVCPSQISAKAQSLRQDQT